MPQMQIYVKEGRRRLSVPVLDLQAETVRPDAKAFHRPRGYGQDERIGIQFPDPFLHGFHV